MLNNLSIFEAKQPMSFGHYFKIATAAIGIVAAAVEVINIINGDDDNDEEKKKKKEEEEKKKKCSILVKA